jgi:stage II sporulation protein GA (sporulation sigma-E factor processing peptidase)
MCLTVCLFHTFLSNFSRISTKISIFTLASFDSIRNRHEVYLGKTDIKGALPMPVIYIDVVWFVNFVMDGVLLLTTSWILHRRVRPWRMVAGAFIGACYSLLLFFPAVALLTNWLGKAMMTLIMVDVGIGRRSWMDLVRVCLVFFGVSFVFAGAAIFMHFALPMVSISKVATISGNKIAVQTSLESLVLLVCIPFGVASIQYLVRHMRKASLHAGLTYTVRVKFDDQEFRCMGLVDSGNQLRDPILQRPVNFIDADVVMPVLPPLLAESYQKKSDPVMALGEIAQEEIRSRFSLVPYRGAGGVTQLAIAMVPDLVTLERNGKAVVVNTPCLFAIHPVRLSASKAFQVLLHFELVAGDEAFDVSNGQKSSLDEAQDSSPTVMDTDSHQITR